MQVSFCVLLDEIYYLVNYYQILVPKEGSIHVVSGYTTLDPHVTRKESLQKQEFVIEFIS